MNTIFITEARENKITGLIDIGLGFAPRETFSVVGVLKKDIPLLKRYFGIVDQQQLIDRSLPPGNGKDHKSSFKSLLQELNKIGEMSPVDATLQLMAEAFARVEKPDFDYFDPETWQMSLLKIWQGRLLPRPKSLLKSRVSEFSGGKTRLENWDPKDRDLNGFPDLILAEFFMLVRGPERQRFIMSPDILPVTVFIE